ncbi:hypothetical protein HG263_05365 [Pseudoalteromonas sp. JBTF-M23]|uniref:Uncharacterized protein n=1 Tax=Pseudoalteromonas caenipelagi TaxID=2726988 RepID=A0A849VDG1_9GAMM|nr:hypothetical protein [Pseudoalteromonas caenipelagi]NOU49964.1 hypothetical protein [Pseudoalteromonas caenipelagi]
MKLLDTFKDVAPTLVTAIGGPYAGLASQVIKLAFGDDDDAQVEHRLKQPTDADIAALQQAEYDFSVKMKELGITHDQLYFADKRDARMMQVLTKSNMPAVLTLLLTVGFFGAMTAILIIDLSTERQHLAMFMLGTLQTCWVACVQFYVGTSKSSQDKTNKLAEALKR